MSEIWRRIPAPVQGGLIVIGLIFAAMIGVFVMIPFYAALLRWARWWLL